MMFYFTLLFFLFGNTISYPSDEPATSRNAALEFRDMISKVTGRSAFDYLGYGCHCGLGGKGAPVDAIDRCCQVHDQCYADTSTYLQFWNLCSPHLVTYSWSYEKGMITCTGSKDSCGYKTCMCDKVAVECFARNTYNTRYQGYSQSQCS